MLSWSLYSSINSLSDEQNISLLIIATPCRRNSNFCCLGLSDVKVEGIREIRGEKPNESRIWVPAPLAQRVLSFEYY